MGKPLPVGSDGVYLANIAEHIIDEKESGSIQFNGRFQITHQWNTETKQWENVAAHDFSIFGYVNLKGRTDKGGKWNDKNVNTMAQIADWWSCDLAELYNMDLSQCVAMITCQSKVGNDGVERMEVSWFDVPRATPGGGGSMKKDTTAGAGLSKYRTELKALVKKPANAQPIYKPSQPEPGSQPWDTPARGVQSVNTDDVPF